MASLSAFPGLNPGAFEALILIISPVRGLRPLRARRARTENVPNPASLTVSPFFRAFVIASSNPSIAQPAAFLDISAEAATASINSALFMAATLLTSCLSRKEHHDREYNWSEFLVQIYLLTRICVNARTSLNKRQCITYEKQRSVRQDDVLFIFTFGLVLFHDLAFLILRGFRLRHPL